MRLLVIYVTTFLFADLSCARQTKPTQQAASLSVECGKKVPCSSAGEKCLIGECREVNFRFDRLACDFNCTQEEPICGSNGQTFASQCDIEQHNCLHGLEIYAVCHNECPCIHQPNSLTCDPDLAKEKVSAYFHQRSSQDFAKLLLNSKNQPMTLINYAQQQCQYASKWAFSVLDFDQSGFLEEPEIIALYLTFNDPCVVKLVKQCDRNENDMLSFNEWCYCLRSEQPSCHTALNSVPVKLGDSKLSTGSSVGSFFGGIYVPMCDKEGFFLPTQTFSGKHWCVDEVGTTVVSNRLYNAGTLCDVELQLRPFKLYPDEQWDL